MNRQKLEEASKAYEEEENFFDRVKKKLEDNEMKDDLLAKGKLK